MVLGAGDRGGVDLAAVIAHELFRERDPGGEQARSQDLAHSQGAVEQADALGRGSAAPAFREWLDEVAPYLEHGQPLDRALAALGEGDGLAFVIGAAVAD